MARKSLPRRRAGARKKITAANGAPMLETDEMFPPPSTSLDTFLVDGSDRRFRDLIYKVLRISTLMLRAREQFAKQMDTSGPQYSMMVAIGEAGTATVGQIAALLHVSSPFVTAEIGKLVEKGVIERKPNKADRRSSLLTLTKHGRDLIRSVGPLRRTINDMIFGSLTAPQVRALHELMDQLLVDIERAIHTVNSEAFRETQAQTRITSAGAQARAPRRQTRLTRAN